MLHDVQLFKDKGIEYYSCGVISPKFVILDDDFESVLTHRDYLLDRGISVLTTNNYQKVQGIFTREANNNAYCFDMHMRKVRNIGERSTHGGLAVGVSLIGDLTNDGKGAKLQHCATLTEHDTETSVERSYTVLQSRGQEVARLNKDNFDKFEAFTTLYLEDYFSNFKPSLIHKNINAVESAFGKLSFSSEEDLKEEIAALLGYTRSNYQIWLKNREKIDGFAGDDLEDRIEALAYIKQGLHLHFEGEIEAEKEWINSKCSELGEKSPWELLTSGSFDALNEVASFVNRVMG